MTPVSVSSDPSERLRFQVGGMTCAGCAASIQQAVESLPGVASAAVSVTDGTAVVTGRDLTAATIAAEIATRGFTARPLEADRDAVEIRSAIERQQTTNERRWRRRTIVGFAIWLPLLALHWLSPDPAPAWIAWTMCLGATASLIFVGGGFYRSAFAAARRGTTNMDTLIAIGATTAWAFSALLFGSHVLDLDLTSLLGDEWGVLPSYFSEAAALLAIISLGHWLEARASARAGSAVRELLELQPDEARCIDDRGRLRTIPSAEVRPGDRVMIGPGDRVAVDGVVVDGVSDVDESVVTGESLPVPKSSGAPIVAGSLNTTGRLVIEATVDGRHTTLTRIAALVQDAQSSKAAIQRLADRVCAIFVPAVLLVAAVTFVGWLIAGDPVRGTISTVTVLIISCPCALGLATPMAVMVGTGAASRRGILVKSAAALERAGSAERIVFDKTGTLTSGAPVLAETTLAPDARIDATRMLQLAASVEAVSEHPIGRAIVIAANDAELTLRPVSEFRALPGEGVRGRVDQQLVEILRDERASCRVDIDGVTAGTFTISDAVRPDAAAAITKLKEQGLRVTMLSGDRREAAAAVGRQLGLGPEEIIAEATPESKRDHIAEPGFVTLMVGDGINDAAALAQADVGIAMASGTNIAIESADIVIPGQHVTAVPFTVDLARRTLRTIRQNLFFAFIYNGAMIPAAAFGLLGLHGPMLAAAAMGASDITVIGNALRLKRTLARRPAFETGPPAANPG
ncbi:MAG: cadmium-translocating P-type ATPase [Phycisphaerae bacterium]|nr:cadmium-translocating P-type ATPase [Phycisphaerae bacterium]